MTRLLVILFPVLMLAVFVAACLYLAKRFHRFFPRLSWKKWMAIFAGVLTASLAGMMSLQTSAGAAGHIVFCAASLMLGFFLFLLMAVALVDVVSLVFKPRMAVRRFLSIGIAAALFGYGLWNARTIRVTEITIPIAGLSGEIRAVHLSDIHLGHVRGGEFLERVAQKTKALNPDVIFNTGDLFDSRYALADDALAAFKTISVPHYFVEGNHDIYVGADKVKQLAKNAGLIVLENQVTNFGELQVVGLNYMMPDKEAFDLHPVEGDTIKDVLPRLMIDESKPTLILHHSPSGAKYMDGRKMNLLLSGHTHGGQVFPFTLMADALFDHNRGLRKHGGLWINVSEGVGTFFTPLRLGTRSEVILVRLVPER